MDQNLEVHDLTHANEETPKGSTTPNDQLGKLGGEWFGQKGPEKKGSSM